MCAAPLLRVICATNPCTWASASWIVARIGAPRAHTPSQQSSLERFPWNFAEIAGIFNFWDVGRRFRVRVYRRLCWSSGAHPSAHRRGERGCQNLSDVSGQRGWWLGFPRRTAAALSFLGPECDVEKAKLSSVSFFHFGKKDDGFGRSLVLVPLRSCSVFSFLILTALLVAIYQGLEGGHFCSSLSFLFSRVSLLSVIV